MNSNYSYGKDDVGIGEAPSTQYICKKHGMLETFFTIEDGVYCTKCTKEFFDEIIGQVKQEGDNDDRS